MGEFLNPLLEDRYQLLEVAEHITFLDDEDQIIWSYSSDGKYSVQSLYAVVNHRRVISTYVHTVWKLHIPPRVQVFLWLLSNNRLTRDNLAKTREVLDSSCLFCAEKESVDHLLFQCCAVLWCLWKLRNDFCFLGIGWSSEKQVFLLTVRMLRRWMCLVQAGGWSTCGEVCHTNGGQGGETYDDLLGGYQGMQGPSLGVLTAQSSELVYKDANSTSSESVLSSCLPLSLCRLLMG